jgi:hypothetical protein
MGYVLLTLGFTGLLADLLPHGCIGRIMGHDDGFSPALMTAFATPICSGPLQGMMRLGLEAAGLRGDPRPRDRVQRLRSKSRGGIEDRTP